MYMYGYRNGLKQRKNIISAKDKIHNHQIKQLRLQLYNNIYNIIY